jgi:hypothetical protein
MNSRYEMYETELGEELRKIADSQPFTPDIAVIERRGHQRRRRGQALRALGGLAGVAAVAGVGVAMAGGVITGTHNGTPGTTAASRAAGATAGRTARTAPAETVAYLRKQIAAINTNDFLIKSRENTSSVGTPSVMITIWYDPRTGSTMLLEGSGASQLTYWEEDYFDSNQARHEDMTQVNYGPRTWWKDDEQYAGEGQGPGPAGPAEDFAPQSVAQLLAHGATIIGHPYVDGHNTVELSVSNPVGVRTDLWIDAQTYQLVRMIRYFPASLQAPPIVANYTWVARSASQAAVIDTPQIPAGFTQVPAGT